MSSFWNESFCSKGKPIWRLHSWHLFRKSWILKAPQWEERGWLASFPADFSVLTRTGVDQTRCLKDPTRTIRLHRENRGCPTTDTTTFDKKLKKFTKRQLQIHMWASPWEKVQKLTTTFKLPLCQRQDCQNKSFVCNLCKQLTLLFIFLDNFVLTILNWSAENLH